MDPITHSLAGAVMSRVGGERRTPLAMATLVLAANAPDIDIFSVWVGSFASLAFRRGWTHGPIALVLLPFAITGLILLWDRAVRRRRTPDATPVDARWILILAVIGCVSHPALDWLNTYGIRLLMPVSDRWFYGDAVFIVDPWWWLLLITTLVLARRSASLRAVRTAGAVALAYPLALLVISGIGDRVANRGAAAHGLTGVTEILYQPRPLDPFAAQLIAVTNEAYHVGGLRWFGTPRVVFDGPVVPRGDWQDPRVIAARADRDVEDYLVWSRYPYVAVDSFTAGFSVRFGDARFLPGRIPAGGLSGLRIPVPLN
jgi:inner membrane protein